MVSVNRKIHSSKGNGKRHQLYIGKGRDAREEERDRAKDFNFHGKIGRVFDTFCEPPNGI